MKKLICLLLILLLSNEFNAQYNYPDRDYLFHMQGFSIENLNGLGTSSILNNVSNLSTLNPAAIDIFDRISTGLSYEKVSRYEQGWSDGTSFNLLKPMSSTPNQFGLVIPYWNFKFGFSSSKIYNIQMNTYGRYLNDSDEQLTTYNARLRKFSLIVGYTFPQINLSLGIGFNFNTFSQGDNYQTLERFINENPLSTSNWQIGAIYKTYLQDDNYLRLGLSYETSFDYVNQVKAFHGKNNLIPRYKEFISFPEKIKVDGELKLRNNLRLLASLNQTYWKKETDVIDNQTNISFGTVYNLFQKTALSLGTVMRLQKYSETDFLYWRNQNYKKNYDAVYIYAGINQKIGRFNFDFAYANNHLPMTNYDFKEQIIIKFSLGFSF